jgi:hypothetical protein
MVENLIVQHVKDLVQCLSGENVAKKADMVPFIKQHCPIRLMTSNNIEIKVI